MAYGKVGLLILAWDEVTDSVDFSPVVNIRVAAKRVTVLLSLGYHLSQQPVYIVCIVSFFSRRIYVRL